MPKQVWQADDGTQFDNEKECLLYENFFEELKKRSIPKEFSYLPCGGTDHAIAKNFYEFLKSTRKCLDFLESVEARVAPQEKQKHNQIKIEEEQKKIERQRSNAIKEQLDEERRRRENEEERKIRNHLFSTINTTTPKGTAAEGYWKKVYEQKKALSDENYAYIAEFLMKYHRGSLTAENFFKRMTTVMSLNEVIAIFRDIQFTHKTVGWS